MSGSSIGRALGVITARGGSKGIPNKNIRHLGGRPLITYAMDAATQSVSLSRAIVSTDDEAIAQVVLSHGGEVPFLRPAELASDTAQQIDVLRHALGWAEKDEGRPYDAVVLLQPTCPLRTAADIDECVQKLFATGADTVISVSPPLQDNPFYAYTLAGDRPEPLVGSQGQGGIRQTLPEVYIRNGAVYVARRDLLMNDGTLYGADVRACIMPSERSVNIDEEFDLNFAEFLLHRGSGAVRDGAEDRRR